MTNELIAWFRVGNTAPENIILAFKLGLAFKGTILHVNFVTELSQCNKICNTKKHIFSNVPILYNSHALSYSKHCQPILTCKLKTTDGVNRYGRNFWVALLNEFSRFSFFAYPMFNQSSTHMYVNNFLNSGKFTKNIEIFGLDDSEAKRFWWFL